MIDRHLVILRAVNKSFRKHLCAFQPRVFGFIFEVRDDLCERLALHTFCRRLDCILAAPAFRHVCFIQCPQDNLAYRTIFVLDRTETIERDAIRRLV